MESCNSFKFRACATCTSLNSSSFGVMGGKLSGPGYENHESDRVRILSYHKSISARHQTGSVLNTGTPPCHARPLLGSDCLDCYKKWSIGLTDFPVFQRKCFIGLASSKDTYSEQKMHTKLTSVNDDSSYNRHYLEDEEWMSNLK